MHSHFVHINGKKLHCLRWGSGPRLLLAFHGYGNDAQLFQVFEPLLRDRYTVVAVDLPYHGRSDWKPAGELLPEEVLELLAHFREAYHADKVSLLGFSLGGRVSLFLAQERPEWIEQVALIAPDGLAFNTLYYFVTRTTAGKQLFRSMLAGPDRYFRLFDFLHRRKWLDPSRYRFVMHYLGSPESRHLLGNVWPSLRFILPETKKVKFAIRQYGIPVHLYMGRYDRVIPVKLGEAFAAGAKEVTLHILEKGHRLVDEETAALVASHLL